jgi:hypothetical protein
MAIYKINISISVEWNDIDSAIAAAKLVLQDSLEGLTRYGTKPEVSLTREGDRSGANLLSPLPLTGLTQHYRHHKVSINDIGLDPDYNKDEK